MESAQDDTPFIELMRIGWSISYQLFYGQSNTNPSTHFALLDWHTFTVRLTENALVIPLKEFQLVIRMRTTMGSRRSHWSRLALGFSFHLQYRQ